MCDLILATYTQTLAEMEEGGGSPTITGLLDSGLLFAKLVYRCCSLNFAADVLGATNFYYTIF